MMLPSGIRSDAADVAQQSLMKDYGPLLTEGEQIEIGFVEHGDTFVFTNKRLILAEVQGIAGRKKKYLMVPYGSVTKFSVETAGTYDLDAELNIWLGGDSMPIKKTFNSKVDMYELQLILARHVLN